jgi:D-alanyl-D-alanine carboxypeptidase (penicillin-binding protein 5/6)
MKTIVSLVAMFTFPTTLVAQADLLSEQISAASAIVMDANTGTVLWSKDPDTRRPMASTTKMMTALVARDFSLLPAGDLLRRPLIGMLTVGLVASNVGGSTASPEWNEQLTFHEALRAVLLPSGNDACLAVRGLRSGRRQTAGRATPT